MYSLSRQALKPLTERRAGWHVSMFLPMHRAGAETQQNPIRCKNLVRLAEARLLANGLDASETRALLEPVQQLVVNHAFWQHQSDGLALFLAPETCLAYRLPLTFDELVVVTHRFHIKPLLPLLTGDGRYYVLALSQNAVRLLQCTRDRVMTIELEDVPTSMAEALRYDDPEKQLQFHTGTPAGTGKRAAMFHGHGVGTDDAKDNILDYFRQIDRGLHAVLRDDDAPLVLAGVEYLMPLYKAATSYAHVMDRGLTGNPEALRAEELQAQAWGLVEPLFREQQEAAAAHYRRYAETARAATDIETIVPAAYYGRIETLFVALGVQQWGTFDPDTQSVHVNPEADTDAEDLLDCAALYTFLHQGSVYAVAPDEVPEQPASLAAVFRY
jgi:hypothetical protein